VTEIHNQIKCVVWDLDNTLWAGVAVEGEADAAPPAPDPALVGVIAELERRGIVSSVASRNDPSMRDALLSHPDLKARIVVPQVGWEPKSGALRRIAERLNIGLDALAFVDDSPFERAEVAYMLPQVLVLSPDELKGALESPAFNPTGATKESARRAEMYKEEETRREAEASFKGSRADFLAWCDMRLSIAHAVEGDLPRLLELTERTHQLNSTGRRYTEAELRERIGDPRRALFVARLIDRFGDYGTIGAALVDTQPPWPPDVWLIELVMLSCRVEGRGIPAAMLRWIMGEAQKTAMKGLRAVYQVNERNLPIRLLFRQLGFAKVAGDSFVTVARDLSDPLPPFPEWLALAGGV
jgi:FkbH-like protein